MRPLEYYESCQGPRRDKGLSRVLMQEQKQRSSGRPDTYHFSNSHYTKEGLTPHRPAVATLVPGPSI